MLQLILFTITDTNDKSAAYWMHCDQRNYYHHHHHHHHILNAVRAR